MASFKFIRPETIVIASAVRTPWAKFQGQLASISAWQLGQKVVEAVVKHSAVPLEEIQQIFMAENPCIRKENINDFIFSDFFKKSKYTSITPGNELNMDPLKKAMQTLTADPASVVIAGGLESATQQGSAKLHQISEMLKTNMNHYDDVSFEIIRNYILESLRRFSRSRTGALFDAELIPLLVQRQVGKRKVVQEVNQDESFPGNYKEYNNFLQYCDGAAALVLTTWSKTQELNLSPLAVIIETECVQNSETILSSSRTCINNLFAKTQMNIHKIQHWEIDDIVPQFVISLMQHFHIQFRLINPHGSSAVMGHSTAASLPRLLIHLTHSLRPYEYGCVITANSQESLGLIIKKLPSLSYPDHLPRITLYTKDHCPLCDDLVKELELNFCGEYELEKVFIDTKEHVRFLRLYRHDIPVIFLNNQFLCMHRLNHRLLRSKLDLLKR